jgi:hypothetical protein
MARIYAWSSSEGALRGPWYRHRVKRALLLAAVALLSAACEPTLSSEQKAELQKTLAEARSRAEALEKERREAFHAAKGTVAPRPDLGPCPYDKQLPLLDFTKGPPVPESIMDDLLVLDRVGFVRGDEIDKKPGPNAKMLATDLSLLERATDPGALTRAKALLAPSWWTTDLIILIDKKIVPKLSENKESFESGAILGRAYLYRFESKKIECAGVFVAENSDLVKVEVPADRPNKAPAGAMSNIEADLIAQAVKAGKKALVRAGPPP